MFPLPFMAELLGKALALFIVVFKIAVYDGYRPFRLIGFAVLGGCAAVTVYISRYIPVFVWILFVFGCQGVSFKKILQCYLVITVSGMLIAYLGTRIGVIENLRYFSVKRGIRNSFGIDYTTDFAAHVFYMLLVVFYLAGEKLRPLFCLLGALVSVLVYHFCNARIDSASILMTAVLFLADNRIAGSRHVSERVRNLWRKAWERIGLFVMPACMLFSFGLTFAYGAAGGNPSGVIKEIDQFSGGRMRLGWQGIEEYGIHLLGGYVPMTGGGGMTGRIANYFFVDCSYVYLLLKGGVLFLAAVLILYNLSCRKNRHDLYFLYAVALISVNSVIAHHLGEAAYNPFLLAAFAECVRGPGDQRKRFSRLENGNGRVWQAKT